MRDYGMTLEAIERNYGCVAEYNRCMEEENCEYYEPSEEDERESAKQMRLYHRQLKVNSGTPSKAAVELNKEWETKVPKEPADRKFVREVLDYEDALDEYRKGRRAAVNEMVKKLYGVELSEETNPYKVPMERFAVSYEYHDSPYIKHMSATDLDYETMKNVFRDLYHLGYRPTFFFGYSKNGKEDHLIVSNSSLGDIRNHYMVNHGFETKEELEMEVVRANYNEYTSHNAIPYDENCVHAFKNCPHFHYIGQIRGDETEYMWCGAETPEDQEVWKDCQQDLHRRYWVKFNKDEKNTKINSFDTYKEAKWFSEHVDGTILDWQH